MFQPSHKLNSIISLWEGDITKLEIGAIVNSAHYNDLCSSYDYISHIRTVAGSIYKAGGKELVEELKEKWNENAVTFKPIVTKGHQLSAKCIH